MISRRKLLKLTAALPVLAFEDEGDAVPGRSPTVNSVGEDSLPFQIELNGLWDFTYSPDAPKRDASGQPTLTVPLEKAFTAKMSVPGYWDDHLDLLRAAPFWSFARFNPLYRKLEYPIGDDPPNAMLPYLMGVGWYRKTLDVPAEWAGKLIVLHVGGARVEAWVWLNGNLITHHVGHCVPFEVRLDPHLHFGSSNTLLIALDNTSEDRAGTSLEGYQGRTAGLYRPLSLEIAGGTRIQSCYLRPSESMDKLLWTVELEGQLDNGPSLDWKIQSPESGAILGQGSTPVEGSTVRWETDTFSMQPWSDHSPALYHIDVNLSRAGMRLDRRRQKFGLRLLKRDGNGLRLNGRPIMLRGGTEHYYFPKTTMAPLDIEPYRERIRILKGLGFNWIRFHTWVPSEEYMQAADELGMMIQIEAPKGFAEPEWLDIIRTCRTHPSIVLYCAGNEEYLDENRIAFLRELAVDVHRDVPDALFNPQSAYRGVEYKWGSDKDGLGPGAVQAPFPHNPKRLDSLREFADVFGSYAWGMLSYTSLRGDWRELDARMRIYQRPLLSHELGIHGNYLNLDLDHRFGGTRIGPGLFEAMRKNLQASGLLPRAELYYKNSCAWMKTLRKGTLEKARKIEYLAGYDFLGAFDQNWHRSGYPCGIMNDFFELKPGESVADVLRYNGESALLLDCSHQRSFSAGESLQYDVFASLYGESALADGTLRWYLANEEGEIFDRQEWPVHQVRNGGIEKVGQLHCQLPQVYKPMKVTLFMELSGSEYQVANDWDFWIYPQSGWRETNACADAETLTRLGSRYHGLRAINSGERGGQRIIASLDQNTLNFLSEGGTALMLGHHPLPVLPTSFQLAVTGRVHGNLATVIEDHPLMRRFPHDGFCDWQFYSMIENGRAVNFNDLPVSFDPILEVVSSFKLIFKQANLFEWKIGSGALLISTMNVDLSVPANVYLLDCMVDYIQSDDFMPRTSIDVNFLAAHLAGKEESRRYIQSGLP